MLKKAKQMEEESSDSDSDSDDEPVLVLPRRMKPVKQKKEKPVPQEEVYNIRNDMDWIKDMLYDMNKAYSQQLRDVKKKIKHKPAPPPAPEPKPVQELRTHVADEIKRKLVNF
jgi:hypothetical protein